MTQQETQPQEPRVGTGTVAAQPEESSKAARTEVGASLPHSSASAAGPLGSAHRSAQNSSAAGDAPGSSQTGINKELERLNRALRALSACNQALAQASSEQELLEQICDVIVRLGQYRFAWIGYAEQDEIKTVRPVAHAGHEEGYLGQILVTWSEAPTGRGAVGTAIRENRVCVVTDTEHDPRATPWLAPAMARGYRALIALPLRVANQCFGVLAIYSGQTGSFENSEVEMLTEMANNLAFGITAIRSHEETKRASAALREAESRYRQLVEEVPAISYLSETGALGGFVYLSPQVTTILGYTPEECIGNPRFWWDHLNPEDYTIALTEDSWPESKPFQIEYRMRRNDGSEVWVRDEGAIYRDAANGKRMSRGLMIDITERRHAEEALRRSEENYRMFVAQSAEGIYRTEHETPVPVDLPIDEQLKIALEGGYIAECNDAMARMYGFNSADHLLGRRLREFLITDDPVTKEFMETFIRQAYRIHDWESHEQDVHGRMKIFRNTMMGIVENGCLVRTWGIQRDVTERVHLEEQLRNAQQLEAIGRLAGGVAHDFNNILSIIMGHGELLMATVGGNERAKAGLEQIQRAAERAALLTQQLLAFSRKQVLQPKVLDLNEAVTDLQKMLARVIGEDIELVASLHPSLMVVKADPGQMEQVLMNLAINARDAMPQGGRLTMETSNVEIETGQERDLDLRAGQYVMLKVVDTGHGMDAATQAHIFEPFFTTKSRGKGTGLGLATVYGIVKQSGGSIQVESSVGQGTVFTIYLPAAAGVAAQKPRFSSTGNVAGGSETILIVEDEPDLRELTRIFLESYGYRVLVASTAEQAIQLAGNVDAPVDLLLTDVIMPGMSGRHLAEKILLKRPQTRIVYMTGYTDDMVMQHKVFEPGVKLLQKPFTKTDLALAVRTVLDGK